MRSREIGVLPSADYSFRHTCPRPHDRQTISLVRSGAGMAALGCHDVLAICCDPEGRAKRGGRDWRGRLCVSDGGSGCPGSGPGWCVAGPLAALAGPAAAVAAVSGPLGWPSKVPAAPELAVPGWVVGRPVELQAAVQALAGTRGGTVGITTGLYGAGGFGKTTLARMVCADRRVRRRFRGRVYMVTVGRDVRGAAAVAAKVNDVIKLIAGEEATFTDPQLAGRRLGTLLMPGHGVCWLSMMCGRTSSWHLSSRVEASVPGS